MEFDLSKYSIFVSEIVGGICRKSLEMAKADERQMLVDFRVEKGQGSPVLVVVSKIGGDARGCKSPCVVIDINPQCLSKNTGVFMVVQGPWSLMRHLFVHVRLAGTRYGFERFLILTYESEFE